MWADRACPLLAPPLQRGRAAARRKMMGPARRRRPGSRLPRGRPRPLCQGRRGQACREVGCGCHGSHQAMESRLRRHRCKLLRMGRKCGPTARALTLKVLCNQPSASLGVAVPHEATLTAPQFPYNSATCSLQTHAAWSPVHPSLQCRPLEAPPSFFLFAARPVGALSLPIVWLLGWWLVCA